MDNLGGMLFIRFIDKMLNKLLKLCGVKKLVAEKADRRIKRREVVDGTRGYQYREECDRSLKGK